MPSSPGLPAPAPAPGPWPPRAQLGPGGSGAWQPQMVAHPHPEPRSYPLMLRTWDYRWWKPVVGIVLGVVGFLVLQVLLLGVLAVAVAIQGGTGSFSDRLTQATSTTSVTPASMLYLNLSLASLTLVCMAVVRLVHRLRPRWLASVLPGIRWRFLFACLGLAVVALVVAVVVGAVLPHDPNELGGKVNHLDGRLVATGIVILFTTPLQAIGEEYAFRGYLMQAFGSLTRSRVVALLATSTLFALAHGTQNLPLFLDRFAFGLMAGGVVILVGGLEAGIALHILNNLLAFGLAIAFGDLQGTLTVSGVSWWQLPVTVVQNGVYLVLVLLMARRMGLRNTSAPPVAPATGAA